MTQDSLLHILKKHKTSFLVEEQFKERTIRFVESHENFYQRSNLKGHITGSAWVLSPDLKSVLLIHHRKIDLWFQPGGHVDSTDQSICYTAEREALEETGLKSLKMFPHNAFDIDIHEIPSKEGVPAHLHYDIRMMGIAESLDLNPLLEEVSGIEWVKIEEALASKDKYQTVCRMLVKSLTIREFIDRNS